MAKIMKDTRATIDVDTELENIKSENKKRKQTKEAKKNTKKNDSKSKNLKKKKTAKKSFFGEVRNEMAKVKWPNKKEMVKYSIATIVFVIFFALFFYAIDVVIALLKEVS